MGCCGVSVKDEQTRNKIENNRYNKYQQINSNNNQNNQSINIYSNPLKSTKETPNQRSQNPIINTKENEKNNNNSLEHISFHSTLKKKEEVNQDPVKKIKNINILNNVKEYLPEDITRDEIEEMVMGAIGNSVVKNINYKKGVNLTMEHVQALIDIIYMNVVGRNNGDKNYDKILEDVKLKIGFVDVNKDSIRNIMFRDQNPNDAEIEQVLEQFRETVNPKLFVIELLN